MGRGRAHYGDGGNATQGHREAIQAHTPWDGQETNNEQGLRRRASDIERERRLRIYATWVDSHPGVPLNVQEALESLGDLMLFEPACDVLTCGCPCEVVLCQEKEDSACGGVRAGFFLCAGHYHLFDPSLPMLDFWEGRVKTSKKMKYDSRSRSSERQG